MHWNLSTTYLPKQAYQGCLSREIKNYLAARRRLMRDDDTKHLSQGPGSESEASLALTNMGRINY
jgi:hypothetical protein